MATISSLLVPNPVRLHLNTTSDGINIDGIRVKSNLNKSVVDYEYQLPAKPSEQEVPYVMVSRLQPDNQTVTTTWVSPEEAGTVPPDLTVDNLIVNNTTILNEQETGTTVVKGSLNFQRPGAIETSGFSCSSNQSELNIQYVLPDSRPTVNGQILSCLNNGTMSWINPYTATIPDGYYRDLTGGPISVLASTQLVDEYNSFPIQLNVWYQIKYTMTYYKVEGGLGKDESWQNGIVMNNIIGLQVFNGNLQNFRIPYQSSGQATTTSFFWLVKAVQSNTSFRITVSNDSTNNYFNVLNRYFSMKPVGSNFVSLN